MIVAILIAAGNDRLREMLPFLRPRPGPPTLFSQTVFYLLLLGLAGMVVVYVVRRIRLRQQRLRDFRDLGLDLGLDDDEVRLALEVARKDRMKNPRLLLTSASVFDRHVGDYASRLASGNLHHPALDRIQRLRAALGFDVLPADRSLSSTRQLEKGQVLMVSEGGEGAGQFFPWLLVDRDEGAVPVVPMLREDAGHFADLRRGDPLSIRLWREGDTEYCFDTEVVARDRDTGTFLLKHTSHVERVQQRDFFRVEADFDITLFGLVETGGGVGVGEDTGTEGDSAAVALLDSRLPEGEGDPASGPEAAERDPPPPNLDDRAGAQGGPEHAVDVPENAPRLEGRVANISAGGLGMTVTGELPTTDRWLVDPAFDGPFPLAGVVCRVVGDSGQGNRPRALKLKFEELPTTVESEIVRQVFQYQLLEGGSHPAEGPQRGM